ncbi:MAG: N-acetylmuramoyl-L-alanine amidase [Micropruina sp.]|nr:N-acetylmuramoyl-L-alanine amidase [Micropruina sp.]
MGQFGPPTQTVPVLKPTPVPLLLAATLLLSGCAAGAGASLSTAPPTPFTASAPDTPSESASGTPTDSAPATPSAATTPAASEPGTAGSLTGRTIVVDPGHNGANGANPKIINAPVPAGHGTTKPCNTTGTATNSNYSEHAHNWDVAQRLVALLEAQGATVVLTRPNDTGVGPCVNVRADIGNKAKADLVVSIHADGAAPSARGFHVIVSTTMDGGAAVEAASQAFAVTVRDAFASGTGMPRSTYIGGGTALSPRDDIAGLNLSNRVGVMLEAGNMANAADAAMLTDPAFRQKEAAALDAAILTTLKR